MDDDERDLKAWSDPSADDFLKNCGSKSGHDAELEASQPRFLVRTENYVMKKNITTLKSLRMCWETHYRFETFDLYVSILRR
jgi:hypothetical protein